ncbi:hypothetical protein G5I_13106 [Acromyrmex echinatior]|uniref:Uncharacterized protein n=1 Tax=Acromyrmex echinatior TaxID=103372 RepID=F4X449_ACREC|nr:hypothetical protein G5I_13106 [Acromyrmex echinatior]
MYRENGRMLPSAIRDRFRACHTCEILPTRKHFESATSNFLPHKIPADTAGIGSVLRLRWAFSAPVEANSHCICQVDATKSNQYVSEATLDAHASETQFNNIGSTYAAVSMLIAGTNSVIENRCGSVSFPIRMREYAMRLKALEPVNDPLNRIYGNESTEADQWKNENPISCKPDSKQRQHSKAIKHRNSNQTIVIKEILKMTDLRRARGYIKAKITRLRTRVTQVDEGEFNDEDSLEQEYFEERYFEVKSLLKRCMKLPTSDAVPRDTDAITRLLQQQTELMEQMRRDAQARTP